MSKITFKDYFLKESTSEVVYYNKASKELWVSYGQGSGTTAQLPDLKSFLTNKKDDKHYDSLVDKIVKATSKIKPIKSTGTSKLFEIPVYGNEKGTYSIWGGDVKPSEMYYMVVDVSGELAVVNVFKSKNEALSWIKSSN
jgi:hypothetical protein